MRNSWFEPLLLLADKVSSTHTKKDYTTIDVKDFVGKTPLERKLEMEDEEMEASGMLREVQLKQTRAWLRQVEEENEDKLRERLAEQRKVQQEHFRKLVRIDVKAKIRPLFLLTLSSFCARSLLIGNTRGIFATKSSLCQSSNRDFFQESPCWARKWNGIRGQWTKTKAVFEEVGRKRAQSSKWSEELSNWITILISYSLSLSLSLSLSPDCCVPLTSLCAYCIARNVT